MFVIFESLKKNLLNKYALQLFFKLTEQSHFIANLYLFIPKTNSIFYWIVLMWVWGWFFFAFIAIDMQLWNSAGSQIFFQRWKWNLPASLFSSSEHQFDVVETLQQTREWNKRTGGCGKVQRIYSPSSPEAWGGLEGCWDIVTLGSHMEEGSGFWARVVF